MRQKEEEQLRLSPVSIPSEPEITFDNSETSRGRRFASYK
jgi:hypothetical protein